MPGETETIQKSGPGRWRDAERMAAERGDGASPLDRALGQGGEKSLRKVNEHDPNPGPSYYDISLLKPPVWTPEVGHYFFLGGLSAGAFALSRAADRFGNGRYRDVARSGTYVAAAAALPCAPLLIKDLGDPKRFHHMLRVWKPTSPMNLGSWTLTGYSALVVLAAGREWLRGRRQDAALSGAARAADEAAGALTDAAGVPLGLLLAAYTGVLLSTTATPVWCKNPWLGALFSASAVSAGASAVRLTLELQAPSPGREREAATLRRVETAARAAEAGLHAAFLRAAGDLAGPLTRGPEKGKYWLGAIGGALVLPEVIERLPAPAGARRWLKVAAGVASLAGGLALRSAFVAAGRPSADDPEAARRVSRPKRNQGLEAPETGNA